MRMGQGVRTGLGHGASPVSYRHNFLGFFCLSDLRLSKNWAIDPSGMTSHT